MKVLLCFQRTANALKSSVATIDRISLEVKLTGGASSPMKRQCKKRITDLDEMQQNEVRDVIYEMHKTSKYLFIFVCVL